MPRHAGKPIFSVGFATFDFHLIHVRIHAVSIQHDLTQILEFSTLSNLCIDGRVKPNGMLPNPLWIISIKDYGLWKFIGNFMFL